MKKGKRYLLMIHPSRQFIEKKANLFSNFLNIPLHNTIIGFDTESENEKNFKKGIKIRHITSSKISTYYSIDEVIDKLNEFNVVKISENKYKLQYKIEGKYNYFNIFSNIISMDTKRAYGTTTLNLKSNFKVELIVFLTSGILIFSYCDSVFSMLLVTISILWYLFVRLVVEKGQFKMIKELCTETNNNKKLPILNPEYLKKNS